MSTSEKKTPSIVFAITALLSVVTFIAGGMFIFKLKLQLLMFFSWLLVAIFGKMLGHTYNELEKGVFEMINKAMGACIILMAVGALIGAWIASGTVPTLIYAGLNIITPQFFLVTSLLLCSVTSLVTGTSWGTIGTVGLALMGIGNGLGFDPGITASTIICGAFFGDKMSPLSDTTNMVAAVTQVPVMTHVRHMFFTMTPALIISLIIYGVMGLQHNSLQVDNQQLNLMLVGINEHFNISFIAALPMVVVFILLLRRTNPVLAISCGALAGIFVAVAINGADLNTSFNAMWGGYKGSFDDPMLTKLLNRGGMTSMLGIIVLVITACGLGGMLRTTGIIGVVLDGMAKRATTPFTLVGTTLITGYATLMLTASCYFANVMTGTLMTPLFRKAGLKRENCSRVVEDAATLGGPLVPWSSNSLFPAQMLGVAYSAFAPWCFLLYLTPLVSLTYAYFNINMPRHTEDVKLATEAKQILSSSTP